MRARARPPRVRETRVLLFSSLLDSTDQEKCIVLFRSWHGGTALHPSSPPLPSPSCLPPSPSAPLPAPRPRVFCGRIYGRRRGEIDGDGMRTKLFGCSPKRTEGRTDGRTQGGREARPESGINGATLVRGSRLWMNEARGRTNEARGRTNGHRTRLETVIHELIHRGRADRQGNAGIQSRQGPRRAESRAGVTASVSAAPRNVLFRGNDGVNDGASGGNVGRLGHPSSFLFKIPRPAPPGQARSGVLCHAPCHGSLVVDDREGYQIGLGSGRGQRHRTAAAAVTTTKE